MTELNGKEFQVKLISQRQFAIKCDARSYGEYTFVKSSGYAIKLLLLALQSSRAWTNP